MVNRISGPETVMRQDREENSFNNHLPATQKQAASVLYMKPNFFLVRLPTKLSV